MFRSLLYLVVVCVLLKATFAHENDLENGEKHVGEKLSVANKIIEKDDTANGPRKTEVMGKLYSNMGVGPWWIDSNRPSDIDIQRICNKVRPVAEYIAGKTKKLKVPFPRFVAVEYKTQLEHGTNYFVKVDAGVCYVHLRIHQDYEGKIKLEKMLVNLDEDYPLDYFD